MNREIKVLADATELIHDAAERVIAAANWAIGQKGKFSIALSGGHTPEGLYKLLTTEPYRTRVDWTKVHIYFGDERCVPPDSEQSNYRMAHAAMLSKLPIPAGQIHRMRGEIDPQEAAREYGELLKADFDDAGPDLILLGMGDDGHTASLFPHSAALKETKHRCVANWVEKLSTWRITMSVPFINRAWAVAVIVAGADKAGRLQEVLEGPTDPERLPVQMIQPEVGQLTWLLDAPAAGMGQA